MTTPSELTAIGLQLEMRERLVRIETKMDSSTELGREHAKCLEEHDKRIDDLAAESAKLQTSIQTLKWVGTVVGGAAALFGSQLFDVIF